MEDTAAGLLVCNGGGGWMGVLDRATVLMSERPTPSLKGTWDREEVVTVLLSFSEVGRHMNTQLPACVLVKSQCMHVVNSRARKTVESDQMPSYGRTH